ncbi:plasmid maintenance system antidote protein, XRE family [Modicisalibacter muralis]|uniref:Plasmid maintenance system antidote protein, XRE family n=1 Tax=Modicisalibacter muralis TaxID=119000 RepID=A0A1G9RXV5_9GAMM|nr:plasmid maintenance system antidote protein, XRE family [Halomonas muralis]
MHNPAHPGAVLREYLSDITVTEAALRLGVTRAALLRILNGSAGMALRLEQALGTSAEMWLEMQLKHELWQASLRPRAPVVPLG